MLPCFICKALSIVSFELASIAGWLEVPIELGIVISFVEQTLVLLFR